MGMSRQHDYEAAIDYLKEKGKATAKDLAVDVFGIKPRVAASWGCHILHRLEAEGRVRRVTKGRPGSGAALWALTCIEEHRPTEPMFEPAYPQNDKPCYTQYGVEVHVYGHGLRVCNCGKMRKL